MSTQTDKAVIDLVINGQQSETSLYKIKTAAVNAQKALSRMAETDPGYKQQKKDLEALLVAQDQRTVRLKRDKEAFDKYSLSGSQLLTGIVGGNLLQAGFSKLLELGPAVIDRSMKIKDSFADIGKAADMSTEEVEVLNGKLKQMNTRTATEDLRGIAVVAGQFGIAKKDMEGFIESADKLNVALGDQFDSVEKVAEVNLTLRNTFQDIKSENIGEDMLHIGNAINFLEAQGAATAPVMADFSSRIGGVAIPLGLTSGQVLGLSATLQELNVTSERGSTAVVDILNGIAKAPESFAKYAKSVDGASLSSKQFKELVNKDLNGALMAVIRGFKEGDTSATGMAAKLADMDLKGNGVMEVFMKLITNTELLTDRQKQASEQLKVTTSITGEFDKKNHELSVNLKKLGEWFDSFLESKALINFADGLVSITVKLLGLNENTKSATKLFTEHRTKVIELDSKLAPLADRYDQLAKKTRLSKDEQAELKKLTAELAANMPQAVTQFDSYGRAISVSTTRMRELIQAQKDMQASMKKEAVAEQQLQLRSLDYQRQQLEKKLKSGENVSVSASGNVTATPLSPDDIAKIQKDLQANYQKVQDTLRAMKEIEGITSAADRRKARRAGEAPAAKPDTKFGTDQTEAERKAQAKKEKEANRRQERAEKIAYKQQFALDDMKLEAIQRLADLEGNEFEKEQIAFGDRYAKMFKLASGNKIEMQEVTALMYDELAALQKKQHARELKEEEKHSKEMLQVAISEAEAEKERAQGRIRAQVAAGSLSPAQGKLAELKIDEQFIDAKEALYTAHYKSLETLADGNKKEIERIGTELKDAQAKTDIEIAQNTAAQATASAEIRKEDLDNSEDVTKRKIRHEREWAEARRQVIGEMSSVLLTDWTASIQGYKDYWKQATAVQKVALIATKAWALAEIGINLSRQISLVSTAAAVMDAFVPFSGEAFRLKGYAIAIGQAAIQTAKVVATGVSTPAFKYGGFTETDDMPAGYTAGPTYYARKNFIAGEDGTEWIMSAPMLRNPVMANLAGALQALQVSGQWRSLSLSGGPAGGPSTTGQAGQSNAITEGLLLGMLQQLQENNRQMAQIANRPINYNHFKVQQLEQEIAQIDLETSL